MDCIWTTAGFVCEPILHLAAEPSTMSAVLRPGMSSNCDCSTVCGLSLANVQRVKTLSVKPRAWRHAGECCHGEEPGFFRACYAWMDDIGALPATVQRIQKCLPQ